MSDTLSRSRGDRYALSALKNKRATIAAEIVHLERQLRHLRESLVHVDATLRLLDPETAPEAIPNKRLLPKRIKLFRQGELGRMIYDALRNGDPDGMRVRDVVTALLEMGGHGEDARRAVSGRVRGNLGYMGRRGKVKKIACRDGSTRWMLS